MSLLLFGLLCFFVGVIGGAILQGFADRAAEYRRENWH